MLATLASIALAFSSQPIPEEGCFNYYTGTCSGCGKPRMCGFSPHTDEQKTYSMPTYYTGNMSFCSHCPGGEGCWDGAFGGTEHCTCVTEDRCIANSPAYVPCTDCGADGPDPPLKQLPQPDPSPSPSPSPSPTEMGPFNVFEFKTKAAFDACDFSSDDTSTLIPNDSPSASNKVPPVASNTVTFGTPTLVDDGPLGRPVRYFGGSPTKYCLAGQRLTAYGSAGTAAASTKEAREAAGLSGGITYRNTQWGDPATWNAADGFTFSFVQADDIIIFDYPKEITIEDESDETCNGVTYPDDGKLCGITYDATNVCSYSCEVGWDGLPPCKCASCGCYAGECCTNESA